MPETRALRRPRWRGWLGVLPLAFLLLGLPPRALGSDRAVESILEGGNQICANGFPCAFYFLGNTEDGGHVYFMTGATLVPEDTDSWDDLYDRHDGRWTLVTPAGPNRSQFFFEAASRDGSHVLFTSPDRLVPQDTDNSDDLYDSDGSSLRLASIGPGGGNAELPVQFSGISADGSRVYFTTRESLVPGDTDANVDLYVREGDRLERVSPGPPIRPSLEPVAYFAGSSPNSTHDFFVTDKQVLPDDLDDCPDIYERVAGKSSSATPDDGRPAHCYNEGFVGATRDASHLFFEQSPGTIFVRTCFGQETTIYAATTPPYEGAKLTGFSEDGRVVLFETARALTPDDQDTQTDIYRWENGTVTRVSTGPLGGNDDGPDGVPTTVGFSYNGARAFFMTREPLTANDQPAVDSYGQKNLDVYMYENGTTTLVTTGTGSYDQAGQAAARVSRDGHRVIFWSLEDNSVWEWMDGALTRMIGPDGQPSHPSVLLGVSRDLAHYFWEASTTEMYDWRLQGPRPAPPSPPPSGCPGSVKATGGPVGGVRLSRLRIKPRAFAAGQRKPSLRRRHGRAAVISFRLTSRARVRLAFERRTQSRCARQGNARRRCVRYRRSGTLTVRGRTGRNRIYFDAVLTDGRTLRRGRYRLLARPLGVSRANARRARFGVLRSRR
jgi:hypothetical protein